MIKVYWLDLTQQAVTETDLHKKTLSLTVSVPDFSKGDFQIMFLMTVDTIHFQHKKQIITEICKALTPWLKALYKHNKLTRNVDINKGPSIIMFKMHTHTHTHTYTHTHSSVSVEAPTSWHGPTAQALPIALTEWDGQSTLGCRTW